MDDMVLYDAQACSVCQACSVACIDEKDLPRGDGRVCAYRTVTEEETRTPEGGFRFVRRMAGCMHCAQAPCITACPKGCFVRDRETGLVLLDGRACVGCGACAKSCPHRAIRFNDCGKAEKCDGCIDRVRHGLRPACEMICPPEALHFQLKPPD